MFNAKIRSISAIYHGKDTNNWLIDWLVFFNTKDSSISAIYHSKFTIQFC